MSRVLPSPVVNSIGPAPGGVFAVPGGRKKMHNLGSEPVGFRSEEFAGYENAEPASCAKLVKAGGARID